MPFVISISIFHWDVVKNMPNLDKEYGSNSQGSRKVWRSSGQSHYGVWEEVSPSPDHRCNFSCPCFGATGILFGGILTLEILSLTWQECLHHCPDTSWGVSKGSPIDTLAMAILLQNEGHNLQKNNNQTGNDGDCVNPGLYVFKFGRNTKLYIKCVYLLK